MKRLALALAVTLASVTPAFATDYLTGYVGAFDFIQDDDRAAELGIEYRYKDVYHGLRPLVGIMATTDRSVYGYAGAQWDLFLSRSLVVSPTLTAGGYHHGSGKDLGHGIEFKSGVEVAYQCEDASRIGVALSHISNASLGDQNPGTENLVVTYSYPIGWAK